MICKRIAFLIVAVIAAHSMTMCEATESTAARHRRLKEMSATEQQELRQEQARLARLTATERQRLRGLSEQLASASDGDRLREIMLRYSAWLRTLNASQRTALLGLPAEKRVAEIKALREQQERQRFQEMFDYKLQPNDQKALLAWVSRLIARDEDQVLQRLSPLQRERLQRIEDKTRRYAMMAAMYRFQVGQNKRLFELLKSTSDDIDQLAKSLSPPARDMLDEPRSAEQREHLLQNWVRAALESRVRPDISKDELLRFFNEQLSVEQRERLESLPRERMRLEMQRMYWQYRFGSDARNGQKRPTDSRRGKSAQ